MIEKERTYFGWRTWAKQYAADRSEWITFIRALCDTWRPRDL